MKNLLAVILMLSAFSLLSCTKKATLSPTEPGGSPEVMGKTFSNYYGYGVAVDASNNIMITGGTTTTDPVESDMFLMQLDGNGNHIWTKTYGASGQYDNGSEVVILSSGGYLVGGRANSYADDSGDMWIIKTDSAGNCTNSLTVGEEGLGSGGGTDTVSEIIVNSSGDYVAFGQSDMLFAGMTSSLSLNWRKIYSFNEPLSSCSGCFDGRSIIEANGGYVAVGRDNHSSGDNFNILIMQIDAMGNCQWSRYIDYGHEEPNKIFDEGTSYMILGSSFPTAYTSYSDYNVIAVRTDTSGNPISYNITDETEGLYIRDWVKSGSNYVGAGTSGYDGRVIMLDSSGQKVWSKTITKEQYVQFSGIAAHGTGFVIAGIYSEDMISSHMYVTKIDSNGNQIW